MGNCFIYGQSGSGTSSAPNLYATPSGTSYPLWFTNNVSSGYFSTSKTSWTKIAELNSVEYKAAMAWVQCSFAGGNTSYTQVGVLDVEVPTALWSDQYGFTHLLKLMKDSTGIIGLYIRLADNAPWSGYNWSLDNSRLVSFAILPTA